jgi:uncharacterized protein YyaL (SSP411 family)
MNLLSNEKSPYLQQHKNNPVDWYPWCEQAFKKAQEEDKPIFLSIGYSTCYWCHVMEKDSFEVEAVAKVLNEHFISIKIDREERPDVDQIYMDAVVGLTGHGGWPMSVILTPELKPFYGGTFFYQAQFIQLLTQIASLWKNDRQNILDSASKIVSFLEREAATSQHPNTDQSSAINPEIFKNIIHRFEQNFDGRFGGFGGAPKFPPHGALSLLLQLAKSEPEAALSSRAQEIALFTLEQIARGGIFDQLGGGFHRYSVDEKWLVPHFEKMLYDNALLIPVYLEAFKISKNSFFESVAKETLAYLTQDMLSPEGGFYSAEDAGDVGTEGEFYVWKESEVCSLLTDEESAAICALYGITAQGNFEHGATVLSLQPKFNWEDKNNAVIRSATDKLLIARAKRERVHTDRKIITSWNALTISALTAGYKTLNYKPYLEHAISTAHFILNKLFVNNELLRRYCDGESNFSGYLEDYSFFIKALLDLSEATNDASWLEHAEKFQLLQNNKFWDQNGGGYFYTEETDQSLIIRKKDGYDGAIPSGNSISAQNLSRLLHITKKQEYQEKLFALVYSLSTQIAEHPTAYCYLLSAIYAERELFCLDGYCKIT